MTQRSDSFPVDGGPPPPGGNWTTRLGLGHTVSGGLVVGNAAEDVRSTFSGATWGTTYQRVGCKVSNLLANTRYAGPTAFMSGSGATLNGVEFLSDGSSGTGHTAVWEWVSGSQSEILAIATTVAAGDLLEIEVDLAANTLKCYKNGVQVGTTLTYTNNPSGEPGIGTYGAANIDDWTATDGASAAARPAGLNGEAPSVDADLAYAAADVLPQVAPSLAWAALYGAVGGTTYQQALSATLTAAAALARGARLVRAAASNTVATQARRAELLRSAGISASALLARSSALTRAATTSGAATQRYRAELMRSASAAGVASSTRAAQLVRVAGINAGAALARSIMLIRAAASSAAVTQAAIKTKLQALSATVAAMAGATRAAGLVRAAAATASTTVARGAALMRQASATSAAIATRSIALVRAAASSAAATQAAIKTKLQTLAASAAAAATLRRGVQTVRAAVALLAASVSRLGGGGEPPAEQLDYDYYEQAYLAAQAGLTGDDDPRFLRIGERIHRMRTRRRKS